MEVGRTSGCACGVGVAAGRYLQLRSAQLLTNVRDKAPTALRMGSSHLVAWGGHLQEAGSEAQQLELKHLSGEDGNFAPLHQSARWSDGNNSLSLFSVAQNELHSGEATGGSEPRGVGRPTWKGDRGLDAHSPNVSYQRLTNAGQFFCTCGASRQS